VKAIELLRHIHKTAQPYYKAPTQPLGYEQAIEVLEKVVEKTQARKVIDQTIEFALQSWDRDSGGFFDSPPSLYPQQVDIRTTHSGYMLLWNLRKSDLIKEGVRNFLLEKCLRRVVIGGIERVGFADYEDGVAETSPTYYALRILEKMEEYEWIEQNKSGIMEYLQACWQEKEVRGIETGGFGVSVNSDRTLVSTSHALQIYFHILDEAAFLLEPESRHMEKVVAYLDVCRSELGGFRFRSSRLLRPNLFMTRHIIRTANMLKHNNPVSTAALMRFLDNKIIMFVSNRHMRRSEWEFTGYRINKSGLSGAIVSLVGNIADFLLLPRTPLKHLISIIRPVPFYFVQVFILIVLAFLWVGGVFNIDVNVLVVLLTPLLALEAIVVMGIVWWFVTR